MTISPPTPPVLVLYWLQDGQTFPTPPLVSILDHPPLPYAVHLFAAGLQFRKDQKTVFVHVPRNIQKVFDSGAVKKLQEKGIAVNLSILNYNDNGSPKPGWSTLGAEQNKQLVQSIKDIVSATGIDGIDIDDEPSDAGWEDDTAAQNFYDTVSAIRTALPKIMITSAVYTSADQYKFSKNPDLIDKMNYCCTMNYGDDVSGITSLVASFAGTNKNKFCAGVQAGPTGEGPRNQGYYQFTSLETTLAVSQWVQENHYLGVMLFSYTQDVIAFVTWPQENQNYPTVGDHIWQNAISAVLKPHT
jgi:Glycosyl hydrolases family 18